jgi:hypothetical protein
MKTRLPGRFDLGAWTGRAPRDTSVNRLVLRAGQRVGEVAVVPLAAAVVVLLDAVAISVFSAGGHVGTLVGMEITVVRLPLLVLIPLGLVVGLFDGWQVQELSPRRRAGRIAGHGLVGACIGGTASAVALVGGFLLVAVVSLMAGLIAPLV